MGKKHSAPIKGLDTASSHSAFCSVCSWGPDNFVQNSKIAHFSSQSVGTSGRY